VCFELGDSSFEETILLRWEYDPCPGLWGGAENDNLVEGVQNEEPIAIRRL